MTETKKETSPTAAEIWAKLSKIDVSEHTQTRNEATYLSWAHAWMLMMKHYPEVKYHFTLFGQPDALGGGISSACFNLCTDRDGKRMYTASVECTVTIGEVSRTMWLPVMTGYTNKSAPNPDSRAIGDSKMRCLTKCFAMFGLGHYIYAGEELPIDGDPGKDNLGSLIPIETTEEQPENSIESESRSSAKEENDSTRLPATAIFTIFETFVQDCKDLDDLKTFWNDNKELLLELKTKNEKKYREVVEIFSTKKKEL